MGIDGGTRRRARRMAMLASAGIFLFAVAGCAATPIPAPTSSAPAPAPVFASDEEALAAATAAYANYVATADLILTEGGAEPERVEKFITGDLAISEIESFKSFEAKGLRGTGSSTFSNMTIQSLNDGDGNGEGIVTAYVCSDISGTDVVDAQGKSTVPPERQNKTPFLLTFDLADQAKAELLVSSATVWQGNGVCEQ